MALRLRRGTDTERQLIIPESGELIYTTDTKLVYVGDGSTQGGIPISTNEVAGGLSKLINDTSPQLGGDLDLNGNNITGTGDINIDGTITVTGNINVGNNSTVSLAGGVDGALYPTNDNVYNLGKQSLRWGTGYIDNVVANTFSSTVYGTIYDSATNTLSITNGDFQNLQAGNIISGPDTIYASSTRTLDIDTGEFVQVTTQYATVQNLQVEDITVDDSTTLYSNNTRTLTVDNGEFAQITSQNATMQDATIQNLQAENIISGPETIYTNSSRTLDVDNGDFIQLNTQSASMQSASMQQGSVQNLQVASIFSGANGTIYDGASNTVVTTTGVFDQGAIQGLRVGAIVNNAGGTFYDGNSETAFLKNLLISKIIGDDSTIVYDDASKTFTLENLIVDNIVRSDGELLYEGQGHKLFAGEVEADIFTGDLTGSVFGDDSSIFFDAVSNTMTVNTATINQILPGGSSDSVDFGDILESNISLTSYGPVVELFAGQDNSPVSAVFKINSSAGTVAAPQEFIADDKIGSVDVNAYDSVNGYRIASSLISYKDVITGSEANPARLAMITRAQDGGYSVMILDSFGRFAGPKGVQLNSVTTTQRTDLEGTSQFGTDTGTIVFNSTLGTLELNTGGSTWLKLIMYAESAPTTSKGTTGDRAGLHYADANYIYTCYADYDGTADIWARVATTGATW